MTKEGDDISGEVADAKTRIVNHVAREINAIMERHPEAVLATICSELYPAVSQAKQLIEKR